MQQELLPNLFRTEYSKMTTILCHLFGLSNVQVAEDIASETFLLAAESWGQSGVPDNPVAWLYKVAKNIAINQFKRNALLNNKVKTQYAAIIDKVEQINIEPDIHTINDSQLQMMFAICHPDIPVEGQIGLALRILCGFGIDEISAAFLVEKDTINKRLYRAKEKLRALGLKLELPSDIALIQRREAVLRILYLLFNEGYFSATSASLTLRKDLCMEAMRLTILIVENEKLKSPEVAALLALMCFQASRFDARINDEGQIMLHDQQNMDAWDDELIRRGNYYMVKAATNNNLSKYHFEAAIAYWHSCKPIPEAKWHRILELYNSLLVVDNSPVVALNRAYALYRCGHLSEAIQSALATNLEGNLSYHSLLGQLYAGVQNSLAVQHIDKAISLCKVNAQQEILIKMKANCM